MQVKLFYSSSNRELTLALPERLRELRDRGVTPELIDTDTPAGTTAQELYEVMSYPSVVVTMEDGTEIASWHGQIPPADQIIHAQGNI